MAVAYTESEAQARFPEALNRAREGETVVITCDGEPVAELRPIRRKKGGEEAAHENQTMEERLEGMRREGTRETYEFAGILAFVQAGGERPRRSPTLS